MGGRKLNNRSRNKTGFTLGYIIVCIRCIIGQAAETGVMGTIMRKEKG